MSNEEKLKQLMACARSVPHVRGLHVYGKIEDLEEWYKAGRPSTWEEVEKSDNYTVWVDFGYGALALFDGDNFLEAGKHEIIRGDVVVLDRDYYATKKYIWK